MSVSCECSVMSGMDLSLVQKNPFECNVFNTV